MAGSTASAAGARESLCDTLAQRMSSPTAQQSLLRSLHAPRLTPTTLEPHDWSRGSLSLGFLSNIEHIRIATTVTRDVDGVTLYEVEVFQLFQSTSNIPTLRNKPSRETLTPPQTSSSLSPPQTRSAQSSRQLSSTAENGRSSTTAQMDKATSPARHPDLRVRHRFSDFARLRREALARTCMNAHFLCPYCRQFEAYARFHLTQPLWIVRYGTNTRTRKRVLARFLADLVDLAQSRAPRAPHCGLRENLPRLIEAFVTP